MSPTVDFHFCIFMQRMKATVGCVAYSTRLSQRFDATRNEIAEAALDKISDLHAPLVIITSLDQFVRLSFSVQNLTHLTEARRLNWLQGYTTCMMMMIK